MSTRRESALLTLAAKLRVLVSKVRGFLRGRRRDAEFDGEIQEHLQMLAERFVAQGMSRQEASAAARRQFGNVTLLQEDRRELQTLPWIETVWHDLRYGLRMLGRSPGFTVVAVITLALGIGANTAIFSAVNGILLRPLPYAEPSRLVSLGAFKRFTGGVMGTVDFSADVWEKMRKETPAIEQMAFFTRGEFTITGNDAPEFLTAAMVSSDFFPTIGAQLIAGRPILPGDTQPGAKPVAVVSYALWHDAWGDDKSVLGRTITLDNRSYSVVGVMPPGFTYPISTVQNGGKGVWLPLILPSNGESGGKLTDVIPVARLKKGVSVEAANVQLKTVSARLAADFAGAGVGGYFYATSFKGAFGDLDRTLQILLGAVGLVLLIACVNVSGLLLSRSWARRKEVAIRKALGASRGRLVRQFLTESVLLAFAGGALGLLFSYWGVRVLRAITPMYLPEHGNFLLDAKILWFTLAVGLLAGILSGLTPALQASARCNGGPPTESLSVSLTAAGVRRPNNMRSGLVITETALAVMLVIGATLVTRSFRKLISVNLGFRTDHVMTMDANFSRAVCDPDKPEGLAGCRGAVTEVLQRTREIPGIEFVAVTSGIPLMPWPLLYDVRIQGQTQEISLNSGAFITDRFVSTDYFRALGIPLLAGRTFTDADTSSSQRVAIVDEAFARKYLGGKALGRRISTRTNEKGQPIWIEVVGVAGSAHDTEIGRSPSGEIYLPFLQVDSFRGANFVARTSSDPVVMGMALRRAIWSVDKNAPITDLMTLDQVVAVSVSDSRYQAMLLSAFGALGLILATVGIYGIISYVVTQRTREFGVRMALGAQPGNILRMMVREGMALVAVGITLGVVGALAFTRILGSLLFEIKPTDPVTFVCVAVSLAFVAMAACYIPARRAMRVDPMVALRYE